MAPNARTLRLTHQLVAGRGASASSAVPRYFDVPPGSEDAEFAGHLRWMSQKMELGQDMLLLGPPGSLRRQLALRFCELQNREAEVLTVTRDTTEADLKQRRELSRSAGSRTVYVDSAPVRCALRGRVLVLDGLEKAERNVLPTLNNLLENREMQLDDGRLLIPARRYDVLSHEAVSTEEGKAKLVRVHKDFRVLALAVPCPPWPGNPLDPPLRSRFQARIIMPPTLVSAVQLAPFFRLPADTTELDKLLRRLTALQRALDSGQMPGLRSPTLTYDAIARLLRLVLGPGGFEQAGEAFHRVYPIAQLCGAGAKNAVRDATEQLLRHFDLAEETRPMSVSTTSSAKKPGTVQLELQEEGAAARNLTVSLASPALPAAPASFVASKPLKALLAHLVQDFASGSDCLLIGPAGCGKSALARHLAGLLGHGAPGANGLEFFFLHEEMSSRDLLQRRATNDEGDTIWVDSPLVRAARSGAMCILDGAHRLKGDALCALAPLLQDRQACLAVAGDPRGACWELLLRQDRFQALSTNGFDAEAGCLVSPIAPSFRVLALAEPPSLQQPWLTEELSDMKEQPPSELSSGGDIEVEVDTFQRRTTPVDVEPEILRGISIRKSLRYVRQLWWQSPLDLKEKKREALWSRGKVVQAFDIFLSHTWMTSGMSKFLALLLQSAWMSALLTWFLAMLILLWLYMAELLPMLGRYSFNDGSYVPLGPWMTVFSLPSCLLGFLFKVYMPERVWASPVCFLDAVSINQTDRALMKQAVYGLAGFLKASKELRILWSPPYLSRLWCIFELAAYHTVNPSGKVTLAPLFVETAVAVYLVGNYFISLVFVIDRDGYIGLSVGLQLVLTFVLVRFLRRSLLVKRKLFSDLETFDVELAECRLQYDREFVFNAITEWFGNKEAFTEYVRSRLGQAVMSGFSANTIPIQYQLLVITSEVSLNMDNFVALWMGGAPSDLIIAHFLAMVIGYALCWRIACLSLVVYLCDLVSFCSKLNKWAMIALDFLIFVVTNLALAGGLFAARATYSSRFRLPMAAAWCGVAILLAGFSQGLPQRMWRFVKSKIWK
ncbi:unnamed protein product [Durusdinium trenchii]|uniref:ATPase dynein-related AAA domain-containing protein n=1 Tax=Durusdinium trenchii TaxID=1381693 RepID=A0ABP0L773_9DINO